MDVSENAHVANVLKFCDMRLDSGFPPDSPSQNIGAKRIHFAT